MTDRTTAERSRRYRERKRAERNAQASLIGAADPQAETAANLLNWLTWRSSAVTVGDVTMMRVLGMSLLPQLGGLALMLAGALAFQVNSPRRMNSFEASTVEEAQLQQCRSRND
jgi:hypothetical protein